MVFGGLGVSNSSYGGGFLVGYALLTHPTWVSGCGVGFGGLRVANPPYLGEWFWGGFGGLCVADPPYVGEWFWGGFGGLRVASPPYLGEWFWGVFWWVTRC